MYPYESGDEPYGNVFARWDCEKCGGVSYIQRLSFGETLSEEEAKAKGLIPYSDSHESLKGKK